MIIKTNLKIAVLSRYLLLVSFLFGALISNAQEKPTFHLIVDEVPKNIRFKVDLKDGWDKNTSLELFVGNEPVALPPMAGRILQQGNTLEFVPAYGWTEGQTYTAIVGTVMDTESFKHTFTLPTPDRNLSTPVLNTIYPTADTLPANQLKLYLQFSKPMALGYAYQYIKVYNDQGEVLEQPFLLLEPELWDPSGKRLTLWFDPGRLKRDLIPNKALGTPLEAGQSYHLVIKSDWPAKDGSLMEKSIRKTFYVGSADRQQLDLEAWNLKLPAANSRQVLEIQFGESLDAATANAHIDIIDENGQIMYGTIRLIHHESVLLFEPQTNWPAGIYKVRVGAKLEDLAGNNLNRLFDRDLSDPKQKRGSTEFYWLEFKL